MYKPITIQDRTLDILQEHVCSTKKEVPLCCIDAQGDNKY